MQQGEKQVWQAEQYDRHGRFVTEYGTALLDLLEPKPGERILDLGCGDGVLTQKIAETGAEVVGADASPDFVRAAKERGLDARLIDGHHLPFNNEFDGAFSNAALHWMLEPESVIEGVARALQPCGRFVAEFGGHTNVAAINTALRAVSARHGQTLPNLWYFPTPEEYGEKLEAGGFEVKYIALIPRPTPLPAGMSEWLATFRSGLNPAIREETAELLRPSLCDSKGRWTADYVRLRFIALKRT